MNPNTKDALCNELNYTNQQYLAGRIAEVKGDMKEELIEGRSNIRNTYGDGKGNVDYVMLGEMYLCKLNLSARPLPIERYWIKGIGRQGK